jgi:hypothetical protein
MFVVAAPNAANSRRVQMNLDARDIFEAVTVLLRRGYDHEYRIRKGQLYDLTADKPVAAGDAHVDGTMRFESARDAGDGSNIYAIVDRKAGSKGLLIDAFDALDQECSRELYEQLNANGPTRHDNGDEIASRYGMRKVFKEEFDGDPERFVPRIGFPDFPRARSGSRSRCSGSTRRSNPTSGWSPASCAILGLRESPTRGPTCPTTNERPMVRLPGIATGSAHAAPLTKDV